MKEDFINEIFRLTKLQSVALEEENIDEFSNLMEKKQIYIDKINQIIDNNFSILNDEDKEILRQAIEVDEKNRKEYYRQLEGIKLQLRKIRNFQKRDQTYSNPYDISFEEGIFIDKK